MLDLTEMFTQFRCLAETSRSEFFPCPEIIFNQTPEGNNFCTLPRSTKTSDCDYFVICLGNAYSIFVD